MAVTKEEIQIEWIKFGIVDSISFLGKETIMLGFGLFVVFADVSRTEKKDIVYRASSQLRGDGIQCLCAHRALPCFAIAERSRRPRILVNSFPNFETIRIIEDNAAAETETGYVSISFSEMEFLLALTGLPSHTIIIWNWRTSEKMFSQDTGISSVGQMIRISTSSPVVIAQASDTDRQLTLWEMSVCYRKTLLDGTTIIFSPELEPPNSFCWGGDGELYILDSRGSLYTVDQQTKNCVLQLPWTGDQGSCIPSLVWYKGGLAFSGPGQVQFWKRKSPEGWTKMWSFVPAVKLKALASANAKDNLVGWTETHELVLIVAKGEHHVEPVICKRYGSDFDFVCFVNPLGDYIVTFGRRSATFTVWNKMTGERVSTMIWSKPGEVTAVESNPKWPYLVVTRSNGRVNTINLYDPTFPMELNESFLTEERLDTVRFLTSGAQVCVATLDGAFFLLQVENDYKMEVLGFVKIGFKIADFAVVEEKSRVKLLVVPVSQLCCRSGHRVLVYVLDVPSKMFQAVEDFSLPTAGISLAPAATEGLIFCVSHRSRAILIVDSQGGQVTKKIVSGHQLKFFGLRSNGLVLVTFGIDGIVIVRSALTYKCISLYAPNHRTAKGVKDAIVDPYCQHVVTLGADGSLVSTRITSKPLDSAEHRYNEALLKSQPYKTLLLNPIFASKARAKALEKLQLTQDEETSGIKITDEAIEGVQKTWLQLREEENVDREEQTSRTDKIHLFEDFLHLRQQLRESLDTNYKNLVEEQLPVAAFDLDKPKRRKLLEEGKSERERVKQVQVASIRARDKVSEYVKNMCWDTIETKGQEIRAISAPIAVQSYALLPDSKSSLTHLAWTQERKRLESFFHSGDFFDPWVPRSNSSLQLRLNKSFRISSLNIAQELKTRFEEEEVEYDPETEVEVKESPLAWTGTTSHNFISIDSNHYSQFEMTTYFQGWSEMRIIQHDIKQLMLWFNKQFRHMFSGKEREMGLVHERNNRFRHIMKELNFFHFSPEICRTVVIDPYWDPTENPESIVRVEDKEVSVLPYVSPSEQDILNQKAAEIERLRQLLLADDFRVRALDVMMDGVLEKLWEDEIKKDLPKPKCLTERDAETWNEDDLKTIKAYEDAVRFLANERERYRKILETEFSKLVHTLKESVVKFDDKVASLHLLKLKVESAVGQEVLKIRRIRLRNIKSIDLDRKDSTVKMKITRNEKKIEGMQTELGKLQEALVECKSLLETLQNRDRNMDKNFKKDFPEYSPIICEQLYKLSKKRPKLGQKATMFSTVLSDLGRCAVTSSKPDYLPQECLQYLKDIDTLDSSSNAPAVVSDQSWELMCKLRRVKIDSELKIRACANDLAEAEATVNNYQRSWKACKDRHTQLLYKLQALRDVKLLQSQNFPIQLVLKQAYVEVPTRGRISDFDECIVVTKEALLEINGVIRTVGLQKIKAMIKAANFRKGIIFTEWQHRKLRMEIEDLENKLEIVEKMKVTKELQTILRARMRGFTEDKGFLYLESEITGARERFERVEEHLHREMDETNIKIDRMNAQNEELDSRIAEANMEVNELNRQADKDLEKNQLTANNKRMKMVRERSRLVQKIQEQHNDILVLQTELELVRLRTFPAIKYKVQ